jgi:hypothetical protein
VECREDTFVITCRHGKLYLKRKNTRKKKNLLNWKERRNEKIKK